MAIRTKKAIDHNYRRYDEPSESESENEKCNRDEQNYDAQDYVPAVDVTYPRDDEVNDSSSESIFLLRFVLHVCIHILALVLFWLIRNKNGIFLFREFDAGFFNERRALTRRVSDVVQHRLVGTFIIRAE